MSVIRDVDRTPAGSNAAEPPVELAIRTEHLTKIYSQRLIAVNDMNLEVPRGSIFGLLGPNGAGKTTTLRLLLGLQRPTAGRAEIFGKACGPNAVDVRSQIGYLATNPKLPDNLRPIEYLDLLGKLARLPREVRKPRVSSLLRAVGLLGATEQRIRTFSTGMCTRLGIAASLMGDPPCCSGMSPPPDWTLPPGVSRSTSSANWERPRPSSSPPTSSATSIRSATTWA